MAQTKADRFVSGFVSVLGRPNAGKSTLVNTLVGSKVAIVSSKPQTTRTSIQAVMNLPGAQVVFLDTPGVHEAKLLLHRRMMESVKEALQERDILLWLVDASLGLDQADLDALRILDGNPAPRLLVLNKIDLIKDKRQLLPLMDHYRAAREFQEILPVSALTGEGLLVLQSAIQATLPEGPRYFPPGYLTDQPERHLAAELIREQVLDLTRQEVPHAVAVAVDQWEEKGRLVRIDASIIVERPGQKKIIIGAGGNGLKQIGSQARRQMEALFSKRIYLALFVKVRPGWRQNASFVNEIDWRYMGGSESQ